MQGPWGLGTSCRSLCLPQGLGVFPARAERGVCLLGSSGRGPLPCALARPAP